MVLTCLRGHGRYSCEECFRSFMTILLSDLLIPEQTLNWMSKFSARYSNDGIFDLDWPWASSN